MLPVIALVVMGSAGCGEGGSDAETAPAPTVTATATATVTETVTVTETPSPSAEPEPEPDGPFPPGYPKAVDVADMPFPVGDVYADQGYKRAVAIAPGVWAPLTPGASVMDAATGGIREGFCASIKAYERKFHPPLAGGSCW